MTSRPVSEMVAFATFGGHPTGVRPASINRPFRESTVPPVAAITDVRNCEEATFVWWLHEIVAIRYRPRSSNPLTP